MLRFKKIDSFVVEHNGCGEICIDQWDDYRNEPVTIVITLDQFRVLQRWVDKNEVEIVQAWNSGVDDGEG